MTQIITFALKLVKYFIYFSLITYFFSFILLSIQTIIKVEEFHKHTLYIIAFSIMTIITLIASFLFQRIVLENSFFKSIALSTFSYLVILVFSFIIFKISHNNPPNEVKSNSFKSLFLDYHEINNIHKIKNIEEATSIQKAFIEYENYFFGITILINFVLIFLVYKRKDDLNFSSIFFKLNFHN